MSSPVSTNIHFLPQHERIRAAVGALPLNANPPPQSEAPDPPIHRKKYEKYSRSNRNNEGRSESSRSRDSSSGGGLVRRRELAVEKGDLAPPKDARRMMLFLDCAQFCLLRMHQYNRTLHRGGMEQRTRFRSSSATDNILNQLPLDSEKSYQDPTSSGPYTLDILAWMNSVMVHYTSHSLLTDDISFIPQTPIRPSSPCPSTFNPDVKIDSTRSKSNDNSKRRSQTRAIQVFSVDMDESGIPILTPAKDDQDPVEMFQTNILNLIDYNPKSKTVDPEVVSIRVAQMEALTHQHAKSLLTEHYPFHYLVDLFVRQVTLYLRQPSSAPNVSKQITSLVETFVSIMVQMMYWVHRRFSERTLKRRSKSAYTDDPKLTALEETVIPTLSGAVTEVIDDKLSSVLLRWYRRIHYESDRKLAQHLNHHNQIPIKTAEAPAPSASSSRPQAPENQSQITAQKHLQEETMDRETGQSLPSPTPPPQKKPSQRPLKSPNPLNSPLSPEPPEPPEPKSKLRAKPNKQANEQISDLKSKSKSSSEATPGKLPSEVRRGPGELISGSHGVIRGSKGMETQSCLEKTRSAQRHLKAARELELTGNRSRAYREITKAIGVLLEAAKIEKHPSARIELQRRVASLVGRANLLMGKRHLTPRHIRQRPGTQLTHPGTQNASKSVGSSPTSNRKRGLTSASSALSIPHVNPNIKGQGGLNEGEGKDPDLPVHSPIDVHSGYLRPKRLTSYEPLSPVPASSSEALRNLGRASLESGVGLPVAKGESEIHPKTNESPVQEDMKTEGKAVGSEISSGGIRFSVSSSTFRSAPKQTPKKLREDIPPAPTTTAPPPPKRVITRDMKIAMWKDLRDRLKPGIDSMHRFFEAQTVSGKLDHLCYTCMQIPNQIKGDSVSADDLLSTLILCMLHANPQHLGAEAAFLDGLASVLIPEASLDHRGYCITTFLCAADFLRGLNGQEGIDSLLQAVAKLYRIS